jgi:WD40 repeat protein
LIEDFYDASLWFHCRTSKEWLLTLRDRWIQWNDELEIFENFENRKISCVDYLDIIRSCVRSSIIDQIIHTWLFSRQFDCMRECRNEFGRVQLSYLREANNRVISQGWYKYIRALRLPNLKPLCLHANEAR